MVCEGVRAELSAPILSGEGDQRSVFMEVETLTALAADVEGHTWQHEWLPTAGAVALVREGLSHIPKCCKQVILM